MLANSKFKKCKKILKNIKKIGIKEASMSKVRANFCCVWTLQELVEKKTKFDTGKNFGKNDYFVFFLLELLACHLITKTCKHLAHPNLFDAKKFIFFEFSCNFFEFTVHKHIYLLFFLCHDLLECPNSMEICMHLVNMSIFDPTKFQIFQIFQLFFSGRSKHFDQL